MLIDVIISIGDIICTENYNYEDDFCCSLRLSTIAHENHSKILLACGMQNHNVNLYLSYISHFDKDENLFRHIKTINTQHKNWITSIDFARIHCTYSFFLILYLNGNKLVASWC